MIKPLNKQNPYKCKHTQNCPLSGYFVRPHTVKQSQGFCKCLGNCNFETHVVSSNIRLIQLIVCTIVRESNSFIYSVAVPFVK